MQRWEDWPLGRRDSNKITDNAMSVSFHSLLIEFRALLASFRTNDSICPGLGISDSILTLNAKPSF